MQVELPNEISEDPDSLVAGADCVDWGVEPGVRPAERKTAQEHGQCLPWFVDLSMWFKAN